jgi:hypothetical protein
MRTRQIRSEVPLDGTPIVRLAASGGRVAIAGGDTGAHIADLASDLMASSPSSSCGLLGLEPAALLIGLRTCRRAARSAL